MNYFKYSRKDITNIAIENNFTATNVEKVIRLACILDDLSTEEAFKGKLALKGGTAINLVILPELPRLSVDLDLDLAIDCSKDEMLKFRKELDEKLMVYCSEAGYTLGKRESYSLCSYELIYDTVTGSRDKIKLDINYLARCHVFEPVESAVVHPFDKTQTIKVLHLQPAEVFGGKIGAFFERTKPRDLYDIYSLSKSDILSSKEDRNLLKKCAVFYSTIGDSDNMNLIDKDIESLTQMSFGKIKSQLLPMLRIKSGAYPKEEIEKSVASYVTSIMKLDDADKEFIVKFHSGDYQPQLLFGSQMSHLEHHQVALATLNKIV